MGRKHTDFRFRQESRMIPVTDNWYPNYPDDTISVYIKEMEWRAYEKSRKPRYWVKIVASGRDDFAMSLEADCGEDRYRAERIYTSWRDNILDKIPTDGITQQWFLEHGFIED